MIFLLAAALLLAGCARTDKPAVPDSTESSPFVPDSPAADGTPEPVPEPGTDAPADNEKRPVVGLWVSYLEWMGEDLSTEQGLRAYFGTVCDTAVQLGVNTLYVQVRPFSDAFYRSRIYPWSNYLTGEQGKDPGYDPLAVMVEMAHAQGLAIEAWVNPYRVQASSAYPGCAPAPDHPYLQHPEWVKQVGDGLYFDPASAEVREMITAGVVEIVQNYDVDGIQFDDYFYPTTDPAFDAADYAAADTLLELADWRRENVNTLVAQVYAAVKQADPGCRFGISPQGNPDNNYDGQYSDVDLWMSTPGYLDYVLPQTYWGFGYQLKGGSTRFAFENITGEWLAKPRLDTVDLYFGLGAYRIGAGDGGYNADSESQWNSGHNLADQIAFALAQGADGVALYRYANLVDPGSAAEYEAIRALELADMAVPQS